MTAPLLFLGAGASALSGAPTFDTFYEAMTAGQDLSEEVLAQVQERSVDIFTALRSGGIDEGLMADLLTEALSRPVRPSVVHELAAANLAAGENVWTTNYDELIEIAASDIDCTPHVLVGGVDDEVDCACERGHLLKPYGRPGTLSSFDYVTELDAAWAARLRADAAERELAIYGYSGRDPGMAHALHEAVSVTSRTTWFTLERGVPGVVAGRDELIGQDRLEVRIVPDADPAPAFIVWAADRDLRAHLRSTELVDLLRAEPDPTKVRVVRAQADRLVSLLEHDADLVHQLGWREFEEVTAALLERFGYRTQLGPGSRDHGVDIYATKEDPVTGRFLYLVQCKHYAPGRKVGADAVANLAGRVTAQHAASGVLATTSMFTRDAEQLAEQLGDKMSLRNHLAVKQWLAWRPTAG